MTKQLRYRASHPWVRYVEWARRRCKDVASKWYKFYGAKGITCNLTAREAKFLWERDKADKLKRPSLDRINPKLGYSIGNCQFIEFDLNSRIAWDPKARPPRPELGERDPDDVPEGWVGPEQAAA